MSGVVMSPRCSRYVRPEESVAMAIATEGDDIRLRQRIDEDERLAALHMYGILDTVAEPKYQRLAETLRLGCRASWSTITFVDTDRQWFKATSKCALTETPRSVSFLLRKYAAGRTADRRGCASRPTLSRQCPCDGRAFRPLLRWISYLLSGRIWAWERLCD